MIGQYVRIIYRPSDISVTLYFCQTALHFHSPLSGFTSRKSSHQLPDSTAWSPSNLLLPSPLRSSIMFMGKTVKNRRLGVLGCTVQIHMFSMSCASCSDMLCFFKKLQISSTISNLRNLGTLFMQNCWYENSPAYLIVPGHVELKSLHWRCPYFHSGEALKGWWLLCSRRLQQNLRGGEMHHTARCCPGSTST